MPLAPGWPQLGAGVCVSPVGKSHDEVRGTPAGVTWHLRHGVPSCKECREAHRLRVQHDRDRADPAGRVVKLRLTALAELLDLIPRDHADAAAQLVGTELLERTAATRRVLQGGDS